MSESRIAAAPPAPSAVVFQCETNRPAEAGVIIPVLNAARFLPQALTSVARQQDVSLEVVVIDDGSTDDSVEVAREILSQHRNVFTRSLIIRHAERAGPAAARDTGMRRLSASAALLLDADNVLYPRCARRCLDALEASGAAFVYPILRVFGLRSALLSYAPFDVERLSRASYIDALALVRRSAWEAVGGFPNLAEGLEDFAFWLALVDKGFVGAQVPEILAAYRFHNASRNRAVSQHVPALCARLRAAFPWTRLP